MEKVMSEIVVTFEDIRTELVDLELLISPDARTIAAALLTLAREVNFLRQDLEEKQ